MRSETVQEHLRNALQIVVGLQSSPQSIEVETGLEGIADRLHQALTLLESPKSGEPIPSMFLSRGKP